MRRMSIACALVPLCAVAAAAEDLASTVAALSSHLGRVGQYQADAYIRYA